MYFTVTRYRIKSSIPGVERSATGMHAVKLAAGEIVTIADIDKESGLVEIVHQGRNLTILIQELRECSERVDGKAVVTMPSGHTKREAC
jgi:hypothetical protein